MPGFVVVGIALSLVALAIIVASPAQAIGPPTPTPGVTPDEGPSVVIPGGIDLSDPMAGLSKAALTVGIALVVDTVGKILAERKAGIQAFKALWPLLGPDEQRRWIRKKHKFLHANIVELGGASRNVRGFEESMVSKYKGLTEADMIARVEENANYVWWSPNRLSHAKVHASQLRKGTLTINLWELKPDAERG